MDNDKNTFENDFPDTKVIRILKDQNNKTVGHLSAIGLRNRRLKYIKDNNIDERDSRYIPIRNGEYDSVIFNNTDQEYETKSHPDTGQ